MALNLEPGDVTTLEVNQGYRDATVLAVIGDQALVEYQMPSGTTSLRLITGRLGAKDRPVSYWSIPMKWLLAIDAAGQDWLGTPQQTRRRAASVKDTIAARRQAATAIRAAAQSGTESEWNEQKRIDLANPGA